MPLANSTFVNPLTTNVPNHIETSQLICSLVSIRWGTLVVNGLIRLALKLDATKWKQSFEQRNLKYRGSLSQMFCKIGVLKNFANFTGKHLCWSLFFN